MRGQLGPQAQKLRQRRIAGLRDLIAHEYFRIEIDRVLAIVERDLPPLESAMERLLVSSILSVAPR